MASIIDDEYKKNTDRAYEIYLRSGKAEPSVRMKPRKIDPNNIGKNSDEDVEYCIINGKEMPMEACEPEVEEELPKSFKEAKDFKDSLSFARTLSANWDELSDEEKEEFWKFLQKSGKVRGYDENNIDE